MAFQHFLTLFEFSLFFSLVFKVHSLKTCGDMLLGMMCLGDDFSHELNQEQHAVVANQFLTLGIKLFVATRHEFLQLSTINYTGSEILNFNANVDITENKEHTLQFICQNARETIDTSLIITELSMVSRKEEPIYGLSFVVEQLWTSPLLTETSEHQVLCPSLQVENLLLQYELVIFQRCIEVANSCTSYVLAFEKKISSRIERVCISILNRV